MLQPHWVDYVRANRDKYAIDAIKQALIQAGATAAEADEAVNLASAPPTPAPAAPMPNAWAAATPPAYPGQTPEPDSAPAPPAAPAHSGPIWFLFSFEGRISVTYFVLFLLGNAACWIAVHLMAKTMGPLLGALALIAYAIAGLWALLAVLTKRWHDRDKSALWVLLVFVPVIGNLWTLIECGCLRGTEGPNTYGPDPLG